MASGSGLQARPIREIPSTAVLVSNRSSAFTSRDGDIVFGGASIRNTVLSSVDAALANDG
jgi:hypothetical protein